MTEKTSDISTVYSFGSFLALTRIAVARWRAKREFCAQKGMSGQARPAAGLKIGMIEVANYGKQRTRIAVS